MQPGQMAYDRAITVFSPDGRLFQVEYARVAVTRGNTTVGLKFKNGIVLMADKKIGSRLVETSSIEKIFQIDEHVGAATFGLVADARVLEEKYKENMAQDDAMILGLQGLQKAAEGEKLDARAIEVGLIVEGEKFRRLSEAEVGQYLTRIPTAS